MKTCICGRISESMCQKCRDRSFIVAQAARRPGLLDRLDRESSDTFDAYTEFESATLRVLQECERTGVLSYVAWDESGGIYTGEDDDGPADEDWFLNEPEWSPIFNRIERRYQRAMFASQRYIPLGSNLEGKIARKWNCHAESVEAMSTGREPKTTDQRRARLALLKMGLLARDPEPRSYRRIESKTRSEFLCLVGKKVWEIQSETGNLEAEQADKQRTLELRLMIACRYTKCTKPAMRRVIKGFGTYPGTLNAVRSAITKLTGELGEA